MIDKLDRYKDLYRSGIIAHETWQKPDKPMFPHVLILSEQRYAIDRTYPFKVIEAQTFTKFLRMMKPKEEKRVGSAKLQSNGGIKIKIQ